MLSTYIKLLRVPQWIKNVFIFVPLIFAKHLFHYEYFITTVIGFIAFCILSSIVYIINDIADIDADKKHPVKKSRPIASGAISVKNALMIAVLLVLIEIAMLFLLNWQFSIMALTYFVINLLYSLSLKHIVLLDIFSIAAGFMLRIGAGGFVINVEISSWLILTTMFISLFLAVMKRRSELELFYTQNQNTTRKVLEYYSIGFIDQMATVASAGVIICYALYTVSPRTVTIFNTENLIYTTPFVVFGIFRYMYLVINDKKGEYTTEIMLTDIPMITNIVLYGAFVVLIVYHIFGL